MGNFIMLFCHYRSVESCWIGSDKTVHSISQSILFYFHLTNQTKCSAITYRIIEMLGCQKSKCSSSWPPITTFTCIVNIQNITNPTKQRILFFYTEYLITAMQIAVAYNFLGFLNFVFYIYNMFTSFDNIYECDRQNPRSL